MAAKKVRVFFCNGYNELAFFVTEPGGMKFGKKTSIGVLY